MTELGYLFGRKPAIHPVGYRLITHYAELPEAPAEFDHTNGAGTFLLLGNGPDPTLSPTINGGNGAGDCAFCGLANTLEISSIETHEPYPYPNANTVVLSYFAYNHGRDVGANLNQLLHYAHNVGLPFTGKIPAYAGLNFRDLDEFYAGVNAFGSGYIGIIVTAAMMQQTQNGEPWDITGTPADDQILGGHCVVAYKRISGGGAVKTWGQSQAYTDAWFKKNVEEAHVILTYQQIEAHGNGYGLDLPQLQSDLKLVGEQVA